QTGVELFQHKLRITGSFDHKSGFSLLNGTERIRCQSRNNCFGTYSKDAPLWMQARAVAVRESGGNTQFGFMENGTFTRFRVLAVPACYRSDLLGTSPPDAITLGNLQSADGAEGLRVGAIQRFKLMTALDESSWFYGGMLVDEWKSADTFVQRDETDQRTVSEDNSLVTTAYRDIHRARIQAYQAAQGLNTYKPAAKG